MGIPASGDAGEQLSFSVTARSTFATVAQTTWDFGDGYARDRRAAGHAYAQAGDYTVTVTATDSVGNATQARRQVAVAAAPPGRRRPRPPARTTPPGTTGGDTPRHETGRARQAARRGRARRRARAGPRLAHAEATVRNLNVARLTGAARSCARAAADAPR